MFPKAAGHSCSLQASLKQKIAAANLFSHGALLGFCEAESCMWDSYWIMFVDFSFF